MTDGERRPGRPRPRSPRCSRRSTSHDDVREPGTGAIAVGALPFDPADRRRPRDPGPRRRPRRRRRTWVTEIEPARRVAAGAPQVASDPLRRAGRRHPRRMGGRGRRRCSRRSQPARSRRWCSRARSSSKPTRSSRSRRCSAASCAQQPGCYRLRRGRPGRRQPGAARAPDGFASPSHARWPAPSHATPATIAVAALAESVKDSDEHRFVVDAIVEALAPRCETLDVARHPEVATLQLRRPPRDADPRPSSPSRRPSALELARLLHPTPAVGGTPARRVARADRVDSRRATAAATPVRSAGSTPAATASGPSRCAAPRSHGRTAVLRAGAGIVAGSDPTAEWAETEAKLDPMLRALVRP